MMGRLTVLQKITQSEYIRKFNDSSREHFNPAYFERKNQDIVDCMKNTYACDDCVTYPKPKHGHAEILHIWLSPFN
jgi:hypothetical protein